MLTAESEGGQLKCHPYWKDKEFGPIRLRVLSEKKVSLDIDGRRSGSAVGTASASTVSPKETAQGSASQKPSQAEVGRRRANTTTKLDAPAPTPAQTNGNNDDSYVIIRKFSLSHTAYPFMPIREVTQLHYPSWPDFGTPAQPSHLLALVELSNIMQRTALPVDNPSVPASSSRARYGDRLASSASGGHAAPLSWHDAPEPKEQVRPMLVHCSAGCGRTGAFCTVDSVIDMLKRQRLRTAQRANKRIDDRERWIAQQMEDQARVKRQALRRDSDGDVSMCDNIGPLAKFGEPLRRIPAESPASLTTDRDQALEDSDIDTSWLDDEGIDLIARTVEDFRCQRLSMVQSLRQFVLCYETVIEWIWRLQERGGTVDVRGRARSGSLAV